MFDVFMYSARAILPILLVILLGYVCCKFGSWPREFYKSLNRLCFSLFLPIKMFTNIYDTESLSNINWKLLIFLAVGIFTCCLVGILSTLVFPMKKEQRGAIVQASFRANHAVLGLPLVHALGGDASVPFAALATAVCVPTYNILAVICLTCYSPNKSGDKVFSSTIRGIVRNPLIQGCVLGILFVLIRQLLPVVDGRPIISIRYQLPFVHDALTMLSSVATPVMLFVLGTSLDFGVIRDIFPQLSLGIVLRLIVSPLLMITMAVLLRDALGVTLVEMPTIVAVFASPVAVSSAVMVQQIGGDTQLANQLVVWTCVLSMFTIFVLVFFLRAVGLL